MAKKRGRPKQKDGKSVTLFLSLEAIRKLNDMTTISRNKSKLVESLIDERYEKVKQYS